MGTERRGGGGARSRPYEGGRGWSVILGVSACLVPQPPAHPTHPTWFQAGWDAISLAGLEGQGLTHDLCTPPPPRLLLCSGTFQGRAQAELHI